MPGLCRLALAACAGWALGAPAAAQDLITLAPSAAVACMTPPAAERGAPAYDSRLSRGKDGATVEVELSFFAPDQPPRLRHAIEAFVAGYRVPCQAGGPLAPDLIFHHRLEGGSRTVIGDMTPQQMLAGAGSLQTPVYFNLDALGCLFDVRVMYQQPFVQNVAEEIESSRPEPRHFLDWLGNVELRLPKGQQLDLLGDTFTVSVPCGTIDL